MHTLLPQTHPGEITLASCAWLWCPHIRTYENLSRRQKLLSKGKTILLSSGHIAVIWMKVSPFPPTQFILKQSLLQRQGVAGDAAQLVESMPPHTWSHVFDPWQHIVWSWMPVIPPLRRWRWDDQNFKIILYYVENFRLTWTRWEVITIWELFCHELIIIL